MSILSINKLALDLVARDFSDGHTPTNGGPTKTSRALAIIHLAARDAYAMVTSAFAPRLAGLPITPTGLGNDDATGSAAVLGAGIRAAALLYPAAISRPTFQLIRRAMLRLALPVLRHWPDWSERRRLRLP